MSYSVVFLNADKQVGDNFINCTGNSGALIKELCGKTPPFWDGKTAKMLIPTLERACWLLADNTEDYRCFEPSKGYGLVETTLDFLETILKNCKSFPESRVRVTY